MRRAPATAGPRNIDGFLRDIFAAHGVVLTPRDGWLVSGDAYPCCRSYVHEPKKFKSQYSVRVDVEIALDSERSIVESFGDSGATPNEALTNGCQNFTRGLLHVLLSSVWGHHDDDQVLRQTWTIGGEPWRVLVGNLVCKSAGGVQAPVPDDLLQTIESLVSATQLSRQTHWLRVYAANVPGDDHIVEAMFDNETWEEGQDAIRRLNWEATDRFYSARMFLMMSPGEGEVA